MYNKIGRRIFYDKNTGNVLVDTGERSGNVLPTTVEQDMEVYNVLNERARETYDYIELEYNQFSEEFSLCTGYKVGNGELIFDFTPQQIEEMEKQKTLEERIIELEQLVANLTNK